MPKGIDLTIEMIQDLKNFTPTSDHTLKQKAEEMGISYSTLRRKFSQIHNEPPVCGVSQTPKISKPVSLGYADVLNFFAINSKSNELFSAIQHLRRADELLSGLGVAVKHTFEQEVQQ